MDSAMFHSAVSADRIVELGYAFRGAKALMSAVELGVFAQLSSHPLTCEDLSAQIGIAPRGARDFFDALVGLGLLVRDERGRYANTTEAEHYLDPRRTTYLGGLLENLNAREYGLWTSLTQALRSGEAQTGFEAARHFDTLYSDEDRLDFFMRGMTGATLPVAMALAKQFPWRDYRTMVDIGTAQGCLPVHIAQSWPHMTGGGFDLPPVHPFFERYVEARGLSERLQFYSGDFFKDPLPEADVLVMGRVLHNWDLPTKKMLLNKAYAALPPGGTLIVYERLIDDDRRHAVGSLLSSLNMLLMTAGGFDFTGRECMSWMDEVGFRKMRLEPLSAGQSFVVGVK